MIKTVGTYLLGLLIAAMLVGAVGGLFYLIARYPEVFGTIYLLALVGLFYSLGLAIAKHLLKNKGGMK